MNYSKLVVKIDLPGIQKKNMVFTICDQHLAIIAPGRDVLSLDLDCRKFKTAHRLKLNYSLAIRFPQRGQFNGTCRDVYNDGILLLEIPSKLRKAQTKSATYIKFSSTVR